MDWYSDFDVDLDSGSEFDGGSCDSDFDLVYDSDWDMPNLESIADF
jgi:hypothetical protein